MSSLLVIILLACLAWFWFDSVRAVALKKLRVVRDKAGRMQLQRNYNFELSMDREARSFGRVILLAKEVSSVQLDHADGTTII